MKKDISGKSQAGFGLIEILLALLMIYFLYYLMANFYFKKNSLNVNKETEKVLTQQGIDTTNYKTVVDSTKQKIRGVEEEQAKRTKELEGMK